jgi:hypothetical protein
MHRALLLALPLTLIACAHTRTPVSPARAQIDGAQALAHVTYLASDALEGRGVRTLGLAKAANYIAAQFKQDGLEPGGDDGTYFQHFSLQAGGKIVGGSVTPASGVAIPAGDDLAVLGWSHSGEARGTLVFAGYGLTKPDRGYDDYAKVDAAGKVVMVFRNVPADKGFSERDGNLRGKVATAVAHGAVAVIVVNRPTDKDELIASTKAYDDFGLPLVQVKLPVAEKLFGVKAAKLAPGRAGDEVTVKAEVERVNLTVANVVGMLRGSDPALAGEYVLLGAHYDHLGRGFPDTWNPHACKAKEGMIFPGADDNASGTAGMLETAEAFAGAGKRPRRTLVFVAFVAEEMGLYGSSHMADHPPLPLDNMVAMINLDMIGRLRDSEGVSLEGMATAPEWKGMVERENTEQLRLTGSQAFMEDSDHAAFYRRKKPVLFFFTGLHAQYHCTTDTADLINGEGIAKVARLAFRVMRDVANAPARSAGLTFAAVKVTAHAGGGFDGPRLGIAPDYTSHGGLGVAGVIEGGPAAGAGVREGDLITMLGDREIGGIEDYMAVLAAHKAGDVVNLVIRRKDQTLTLKATLEGQKK